MVGVLELSFPQPPLRTQRVLLRPWLPTDVEALVAAFDDPQILRFSWSADEAWTPAAARQYLDGQEPARRLGREISWAVVGPATDVLLGCVCLYDVDAIAGRASIGYWLAAPARGRGVASTSVRLVCAWAFQVLGLARLELTCGPDNHPSHATAERCGFVREGLLRSHTPFQGGRRDTVVFGLLPDDARPSASP